MAFFSSFTTCYPPVDVLENIGTAHTVGIPMRVGNRSLNLSNSVAVVLDEAWRQSGLSQV
jgi:tRNA (cytidine/uridine-2'-O-)-methyltransferase